MSSSPASEPWNARYYRAVAWLPICTLGVLLAAIFVIRAARVAEPGASTLLTVVTLGAVIHLVAMPLYLPAFLFLKYRYRSSSSRFTGRHIVILVPLILAAATFGLVLLMEMGAGRGQVAVRKAGLYGIIGLLVGYSYAVVIEACRPLIRHLMAYPVSRVPGR